MKESIVRELEVCENNDGYWYFTIKEGKTLIIEGDLMQTSIEAHAAGMRWLDALHNEHPLHNDDKPRWES